MRAGYEAPMVERAAAQVLRVMVQTEIDRPQVQAARQAVAAQAPEVNSQVAAQVAAAQVLAVVAVVAARVWAQVARAVNLEMLLVPTASKVVVVVVVVVPLMLDRGLKMGLRAAQVAPVSLELFGQGVQRE